MSSYNRSYDGNIKFKFLSKDKDKLLKVFAYKLKKIHVDINHTEELFLNSYLISNSSFELYLYKVYADSIPYLILLRITPIPNEIRDTFKTISICVSVSCIYKFNDVCLNNIAKQQLAPRGILLNDDIESLYSYKSLRAVCLRHNKNFNENNVPGFLLRDFEFLINTVDKTSLTVHIANTNKVLDTLGI